VLREQLKLSVSENELLKDLSVVLNNVLNEPLANVSVSENVTLSVVLNPAPKDPLSSASVSENVALRGLSVVLNNVLNQPLGNVSVSENSDLKTPIVTLKELLENVR
jgi:hypothetical protein